MDDYEKNKDDKPQSKEDEDDEKMQLGGVGKEGKVDPEMLRRLLGSFDTSIGSKSRVASLLRNGV
eukprot:1343463-Rhodomonas_salina.1